MERLMRKLHYLIILGLVACMPWKVACANVLITELTGNATTGEQKPVTFVTFLSEVRNGQDFELTSGARAVAVDLASGREYVANGPGKFRVDEGGVRAVSGGTVKVRALSASNLPEVKVVVARVSQAALLMRSLFKPLNILSSANTAVLTPTPTLSWTAVDGASAYKVRLSDSTGNTLINEQTQVNSLVIPVSAGLTSGRNYLWTVEAVDENGPLSGSAASAQFSVAPPETVRLLKSIAPQSGASFSDRVLYAAQLQEAGAIEDARTIWKSLANERPDDSILKKLAR